MGVQIPRWKGAILRGKGAPIVIGKLCGHLHKNGKADRDAVWIIGSDGPKESCVRWGPDPPWEWPILGERGAHSVA